MALAIAAGAIFLALLLSPSSFYSAVTHKETEPFYKRPESGARLLHVGRDDLQRSVYESMSKGVSLRRRAALDGMLRALARSEHAEIDASAAMDAYKLDPQNDLTRLASAMVFVFADVPPSVWAKMSPEAARAIYEKLATILDLTVPTGIATTFNKIVLDNLRPVYRTYFSRPDVALLIADIDAPYFVIHPNRYAAFWDGFPAMQRQIASIATGLEAAGRPQDAARCRSWFHRPLLEVIEEDSDTRMRLLCMDLIIRDLPEASIARQSLVKMRDEFVQHAADAPADHTDLTGQRTAVAPAEYRAVQSWLIAAITLALMGAGAGGAYVIALVLIPFTGGQKEIAPRSVSARFICWLVAVGLIVLCAYLCAGSASLRGPFSGHWTLHMIILSVWAGLSLSFAFAEFQTQSSERPRVTRLGFILPVAPVVLYFLPPIWVVEFSRFMDEFMHPMWAGVLIASIGAIVALVMNLRRLRAVRKSAALLCATAMCVSLAAYAVHSIADVRWQEAAVPGRLDEFAARLGDGWKERLLAPIKAELVGKTP